MRQSLWRPIFITVGAYLFFGILWIAFTDPILHVFFKDPQTLLRFEIYKGWFFILFTSLLLGVLLYRQFKARHLALSNAESSKQQAELAYRELHNSEDRFRATFEQSAVGLAYLDLDGMLVLVNQRWCDLLQTHFENVIQRSIQTQIHPEDLQQFQNGWGDVLAGKAKYFAANLRMLIELEATCWVRMVATLVVDDHDQPVYWILVINDISRLMAVEDELRKINDELEFRVEQRSNELKLAVQDLEDFSHSVSHDLRAPLRAISGYSTILAEEYSSRLGEDGVTLIGNIREASARMNQLIDDLLQYARIGRKEIVLRPIPIADSIASVMRDLASRIDEKKAEVTVTPSQDLPSVQGDPVLLHQVLLNLIDNALTYHQPGNPPKVDVIVRQSDAGVTLEIRDNGIGIPKEHLKRVFQIFQRLHTSDEYPGTGIGLAIVSKAVEFLDGEIRVESTPGMGSSFFVTLKSG